MRSVLFGEEYQENQTTELMVVQNQHMLKVNLDGVIHAKQGSMVAYQGEVDFKYKGAGMDAIEVANALNVNAVLEGSIRKAGDRVRITAQLISASDGFHLWSES